MSHETREQGFAICRLSEGELEAQSMRTGTPTSVNIPHKCKGSRGKVVVTVHTHPGDPDLIPSEQDMRIGRREGLEAVCIATPGFTRVRCYEP